MLVPRRALVDLDDDEAWLVVCPCDRRWWDVDLYPALAADNHAAGFTASTETAAEPVTTPAGIYIHQQPIRLT